MAKGSVALSKALKPQKPWDKLGITYQQYYYRRNAGTLKNATPTATDAMRDKILMEEFLDRFEQSHDPPIASRMLISNAMAKAIYNILRQDGH